MIKKTIIINKIIYYNPISDFFIASTTSKEKVAGVNTTWLKEDIKGVEFNITGNYFYDKLKEKTFKIQTIELKDNSFFMFMKKNIGIIRTEILREILNEHTEEEFLKKLENEPLYFTKYKWIGKKSILNVLKKWKKVKPLYELSKPLTVLGLTNNMINRIYKYILENKTDINSFLENFNENPYILTNVDLVGFIKADEIALRMGIDKKSIFRFEAAILYSFNFISQTNGDTVLTVQRIKQEIKEILKLKEVEEDFFKEIILSLLKKKEIIEIKKDYYSLKKHYENEKYIENKIKNILKLPKKSIIEDIEKFIKTNEEFMGIILGDEQKEAIKKVNEGNNIFALCGYAGTGKTTISKIILNLFKGKNILCTAISGIATDRIRKATNQKAVVFQSIIMPYSRINLSNIDILLIDEASMINTEQFYRLFEKIKDIKKIKIFFVGDKAQLPPIGPGNFFTDLIDLNLIPLIELKTIYRQNKDNVLTLFAEQIRNGKIPSKYNAIYKDFEFYIQEVYNMWEKKKRNDPNLPEEKKENQKKVQKIIINKYIKNINYDYTKKENWLKYIYDNQIISPMKKYILGVEGFNNEIQKKLSYDIKSIQLGKFEKFQLYDKIVHIKNKNIDTFEGLNLQRAKGSYLNKRRIFNGMLGIIIDIDIKSKTVYVAYPIEKIICKYNQIELNTLNLGYAITIHKAQGAEFKNVFIPISYSHFIMLNNKLLYTAITRAKQKVSLVGEKSAFFYACRTADKVKRNTILKIENKEFIND